MLGPDGGTAATTIAAAAAEQDAAQPKSLTGNYPAPPLGSSSIGPAAVAERLSASQPTARLCSRWSLAASNSSGGSGTIWKEDIDGSRQQPLLGVEDRVWIEICSLPAPTVASAVRLADGRWKCCIKGQTSEPLERRCNTSSLDVGDPLVGESTSNGRNGIAGGKLLRRDARTKGSRAPGAGRASWLRLRIAHSASAVSDCAAANICEAHSQGKSGQVRARTYINLVEPDETEGVGTHVPPHA